MKNKITSILIFLIFFNLILFNVSNVSSYTQEETADDSEYVFVTTNTESGETSTMGISDSVKDYIEEALESGNEYEEVNPYIPNEYNISTSSIIGTDDRTTVSSTTYPYSAVGYMVSTFSDGTTLRGTAFLIAPNVALTAGHMVFDETHGTASSAVFIPGRDGSTYPYGSTEVYQFSSTTDWAYNYDDDYDWAVLILTDNIGNDTGWVGFRWYHSYSSCVGLDVEITGYPKYYNNGTTVQYQQYAMTGTITKATDYRLYYTIDTSGGNSGGPIWEADTYYVIGVHTKRRNFQQQWFEIK